MTTYQKKEECPTCGGIGLIDPIPLVGMWSIDCPHCDGKGDIYRSAGESAFHDVRKGGGFGVLGVTFAFGTGACGLNRGIARNSGRP